MSVLKQQKLALSLFKQEKLLLKFDNKILVPEHFFKAKHHDGGE